MSNSLQQWIGTDVDPRILCLGVLLATLLVPAYVFTSRGDEVIAAEAGLVPVTPAHGQSITNPDTQQNAVGPSKAQPSQEEAVKRGRGPGASRAPERAHGLSAATLRQLMDLTGGGDDDAFAEILGTPPPRANTTDSRAKVARPPQLSTPGGSQQPRRVARAPQLSTQGRANTPSTPVGQGRGAARRAIWGGASAGLEEHGGERAGGREAARAGPPDGPGAPDGYARHVPYRSCASMGKPKAGEALFCEEPSLPASLTGAAPNCPFLHQGASCGPEATSALLTRVRSHGLLAMDQYDRVRREWFEFAQHKHILLVGDSVQANMAEALMCLLVDYTTRERVPVASVYPGMELQLEGGGEEGVEASVDARDFCVRYVEGAGSVCMARANTPHQLADRAPNIAGQVLPHAHVVLFNVGLHVHSDEERSAEALELFFRTIGLLKGAPWDAGKRPALLWRETSPQHFAWAGGAYKPQGMDFADREWLEAYKGWRQAGGECRAHEGAGGQPPRDHAFNDLAREYGVPVLRVWERTSPFYFAHPPGTTDCTHYCLPGVPDLWVQWLLEFLTQRLKLV